MDHIRCYSMVIFSYPCKTPSNYGLKQFLRKGLKDKLIMIYSLCKLRSFELLHGVLVFMACEAGVMLLISFWGLRVITPHIADLFDGLMPLWLLQRFCNHWLLVPRRTMMLDKTYGEPNYLMVFFCFFVGNELVNFEWPSHFVEDSFTEYSAPTLTRT